MRKDHLVSSPPPHRSVIAHQDTSGSVFFFFFYKNHLVRATLLQGYKFEQSQTTFPDAVLSCTPKAGPMHHSNRVQTHWGATGLVDVICGK